MRREARGGVRGRPRSAHADRRILRTALRHLSRHGYADLSIEQVAADAGVGKASVYRRYRNKADLATAAFVELASDVFDAEPPLDTRSALVEHLRGFQRVMAAIGSGMMASLLDEHSDPELIELHRERVVSRGRQRARAILARGVERGEIRPDADLDAAMEMLVGSLFARQLAGRDASSWAEEVVDELWCGLATLPPP